MLGIGTIVSDLEFDPIRKNPEEGTGEWICEGTSDALIVAVG
jgi:hypothetical protein